MRGNGDGKPVVALDIDGTMGDYHLNFLRFAALYFNLPHLVDDRMGQPNPGLPLWEWLGFSQRDYREAKLAYRQGGWKRWMPCYEGAFELTEAIREAGAEVWLCTTRPYLRLDNVDPDTREWLRRNRIRYDAVLFDPIHDDDGTKYHELARQARHRVASIVDDLPEMIRAAQNAFHGSINHRWLAPIVRDQPYNQHFVWDRRAADLTEVLDLVLADIGVWRGWNARA